MVRVGSVVVVDVEDDGFLIIIVSIILGWSCITLSRPTSIESKGLVTCVPLGINKMRCII